MRVNIFIRKENEDKWKSIHNKSDWINTLLANSDDTSEYGKTIHTPVGPAVVALQETIRPLGEILSDIKALEAERDTLLEENQDPQEARKIASSYKNLIQPLWDEYHRTKGA